MIVGGLTASKSVSQDSGIGFRSDSLPRNTYLAVDEEHQKVSFELPIIVLTTKLK